MNYKRAVAEIDLSALDFNIKNIKQSLPMGTKILGTLKANAYGHGYMEVYKVLKENGIDFFSVATLDEAVCLRENDVKDDILVLGYIPKDFKAEAIENNIVHTISSLQEAEEGEEIAKSFNKTARVHIKIDTGMTRLGFPCNEESISDIEKIYSFSNTAIEGIFTHFAQSDAIDKTFTLEQSEKMKNMLKELEKRNISIPIKHCSNSAAVIDMPALAMDMVRPGIILYGYYPSSDVKKGNLKIKPVMSVKAMVTCVRDVPSGTSVGYGRTHFTKGNRRIATISIGYADGYLRALSNKGYVMIRGAKAPIVGNVCMDQCMADVTDIPLAKVTDQVTVLGSGISADDIADLTGTISYEILCLINHRIPRVYK